MDADWMQRTARTFADHAEAFNEASSGFDHVEADRHRKELLAQEFAIRRLVETVNAPPINAGLATDRPTSLPPFVLMQFALRLLGVCNSYRDVAEALRPDGPILSSHNLHPQVWEAARPLWTNGHPAQAVEVGAKSLNSFIQKKSRVSHQADRKLVTAVFSINEPQGESVRLWFPGERATETWKSQQEGLHNLAMGAFSGIRNVASHTYDTGWTESECLQYLAVLSTVARWTEATTRVVSSGPDLG